MLTPLLIPSTALKVHSLDGDDWAPRLRLHPRLRGPVIWALAILHGNLGDEPLRLVLLRARAEAGWVSEQGSLKVNEAAGNDRCTARQWDKMFGRLADWSLGNIVKIAVLHCLPICPPRAAPFPQFFVTLGLFGDCIPQTERRTEDGDSHCVQGEIPGLAEILLPAEKDSLQAHRAGSLHVRGKLPYLLRIDLTQSSKESSRGAVPITAELADWWQLGTFLRRISLQGLVGARHHRKHSYGLRTWSQRCTPSAASKAQNGLCGDHWISREWQGVSRPIRSPTIAKPPPTLTNASTVPREKRTYAKIGIDLPFESCARLAESQRDWHLVLHSRLRSTSASMGIFAPGIQVNAATLRAVLWLHRAVGNVSAVLSDRN
ncbi:hypothetical protein DFH09DRAFT_1100677 [Mycena vulgaris]|nr:hypothetical protein DFH09DRAFT_1100677 [Mycena vulgaris]